MEIINNNSESSIPQDAQIVVALDIGTTKIATIVGAKNKYGKIEILGYANIPSKGILRGTVSNIKDASESIGKSILQASNNSNVQIEEVVVGVASQSIKSFNQSTSLTLHNSEGEITENIIQQMIADIRQISQRAECKIISIMPQDFTIDNVHGIINPIGYSGRHIKGNFHVISVSDTVIKNIDKSVKANNLKIQEFFLEPIASAAAVLTEEQKETGVCLIDIGGGTTDIAIYHDGIIRYSAVIPFGGDVITKDIKEVCKLSEKEAEQLKQEKGHAYAYPELKKEILKIRKERKNTLEQIEQIKTINSYHLAEIIECRVKEIIGFIEQEIEKSGYKEKLAEGIMLTGGGSLLKNISELFIRELGIDTNIGIPNQHIVTSIQELKSPIYSTAIGLLILGFENLNATENKEKANNNTESNKELSETTKIKELNSKRHKTFFSSFVSSIKNIFDTPDNLN